MRAEFALGRFSNNVPVSRRGLDKAKHVDTHNLWIQEASKSGQFVAKKVGTNVNPADMMTKAAAEAKGGATHESHGLRVHENRCSDTKRVDHGERNSVTAAETISLMVLLRYAMCGKLKDGATR